MKKSILIPILVFLSVSIFAQIHIPFNSSFKYIKGLESTDSLSGDWVNTEYNDINWLSGNAPFYYGSNHGIGTFLDDMQGNYTTLFLRNSFSATDISSYQKIKFDVSFNDGFILYLNGEEVISCNAPEETGYKTLSLSASKLDTVYTFFENIESLNLKEGKNTLSAVVFCSDIADTNFYFDIKLTSFNQVISDDEIQFSQKAGFYSNPFRLILNNNDTTLDIIYTLDGSNPVTSTNSFRAKSPVMIIVNPDSTNGRSLTPAFVVKASLVKGDYLPSVAKSQTYIFPEAVKKQGSPGENWPVSREINNQYFFYDMSSAIVEDSIYSKEIDAALNEIPSLSVTTNMEHLFDAKTGIYVNAYERGREWERECSFELIYPDGQEGFEIPAGMRIRGGFSRSYVNPKHSFRLFFREQYGADKLRFSLFEEEGAEKFDKIDLRTAQNYSWSNVQPRFNIYNTFVRDVFSRDAQRQMGQPYTRSRYYHLYLNGMYWGIYQTQEHSEARYAETYFGGDDADYDVIKVTALTRPKSVIATDGVLDTWRELYEMTLDSGRFVSNKVYYALEGKDSIGMPEPGAKVYLDYDNLIDYMMVIFYTGNFDAPTTRYIRNKTPNNFFAIYNRNNPGTGFKFFAHDSEHSLLIDSILIFSGISENRVNIGDVEGSYQMAVDSFETFQPQWLHFKLLQNNEYRQRFIDRAYKYLGEGGLFSPDTARKYFMSRACEIDTAIVAESARWGWVKGNNPIRSKYDHWLPEINRMCAVYFDQRLPIVINQLITGGLYSIIEPPLIKEDTDTILQGDYFIDNSVNITLKNENSEGIILYTLNGDDPRETSGSISTRAFKYTQGNTMKVDQSMIFKTRVLKDTIWSALKKVVFIKKDEDYSKLKVTELQYKPVDYLNGDEKIKGKQFEFIEFKNTGEESIYLGGLKLDSAVTYVFPDDAILNAGDFYVVASNRSEFLRKYGVLPSGFFSGSLSNGGEYVLLTDASKNEILSFTYDNKEPWPEKEDITDFSIVPRYTNPTDTPDNPEYWWSTRNEGGTPFADDYGLSETEEAFALPFSYILYPNPVKENAIITINENSILPDFIELVSFDGRVIYYMEVNSNRVIFPLNALNIMPGIYLVRMHVNRNIYTDKIIYLGK